MELKAVVTFSGALAHYTVTPDKFGIYHARLLKYEGGAEAEPPGLVLLVKGVHQWVSSCEEGFSNALGAAIEQRAREGSGEIVNGEW